jgi:hypothetical protein
VRGSGPANPLGYRCVGQPAENFANLAQRLGTALPNHSHRHVLCLHSSFAFNPLRRFAEQFHESSAISIIMEDSLARVTPPAEMIDGIFKLYPQRPRHSFCVVGPILNVKCLDLTPSYFSSFFAIEKSGAETSYVLIMDEP